MQADPVLQSKHVVIVCQDRDAAAAQQALRLTLTVVHI